MNDPRVPIASLPSRSAGAQFPMEHHVPRPKRPGILEGFMGFIR